MKSRWAIALVLGLAVASPVSAGAGPGYTIEAPESVSTEAGQNVAVSLAIVPAADRSIAGEAPLRIRLSVNPQDGAAVTRAILDRSDAADPRARSPRFDLDVRADKAGNYRLTADIRFWLCGRHTCWPIRTSRTVDIAVAPAPGPAPDAGSRTRLPTAGPGRRGRG